MSPKWMTKTVLCAAAAMVVSGAASNPAAVEVEPAGGKLSQRMPRRPIRLTSGSRRPDKESSPDPSPWLLITISLVAGCIGAAAVELLVPALTMQREERWSAGLFRVSIGGGLAAAAGLARFTVDEASAGIAGTALMISACADAVLLASRWRGRARVMEQERDCATARLQTATRTFIEQIEGLRQAVLGAYVADETTINDSAGSPERGRLRFEATVNNAFSMARRTTAAAGVILSLWDQVRAILARRLERLDVEKATLAEIGGNDARVRQYIARDIAKHWPNLTWGVDDVTPESTLASLVDEIDGRIP